MAVAPDVLDAAGAGLTAVRGSAVRVAGFGTGLALTVVSAAVLHRQLGVGGTGRCVLVSRSSRSPPAPRTPGSPRSARTSSPSAAAGAPPPPAAR